jgi:hypothetical protein
MKAGGSRGLRNSLTRFLHSSASLILVALAAPAVTLWVSAALPYGSSNLTSCYTSGFLEFCYTLKGNQSLWGIIAQSAGSGYWPYLGVTAGLFSVVVWMLAPWGILVYRATKHLAWIGAIEFISLAPVLWFGVSTGFLAITAVGLIGLLAAELANLRRANEDADREAAEERREASVAERLQEEEEVRSEVEFKRRQREFRIRRAEVSAEPRMEAARQLELTAIRLSELSSQETAYLNLNEWKAVVGQLKTAADSLEQAGQSGSDLASISNPLRELETDLADLAREVSKSTGAPALSKRGRYLVFQIGGLSGLGLAFKDASDGLLSLARLMSEPPTPGWATQSKTQEVLGVVQKVKQQLPSLLVALNRSLIATPAKAAYGGNTKVDSQNFLMGQAQFQWDVAISHAGEDLQVAIAVKTKLDSVGIRAFLAAAHRAELWGKDLSDEFKKAYGPNSRYMLVLISKYYPAKDWTNFEFDIARGEEKSRKEEFILPVRLDDTLLFGLRSTRAYFDFKKDGGVEGIARFLLQKLSRKDG